MRKKIVCAAAGVVGFAGAACAQITPTGPFTGARQEGFQTLQNWGVCVFCTTIEGAFQGICTLESVSGSNIHITGGWGFICSIGALATPNITASGGGGGYDYHFSAGNEAGKFGGYFGTNCGVPDGTAEFYDSGGTLIGTQPLTVPADCTWNWHGWEINPPAARIRIIGNFGGGGYVQMDDMEWEPGTNPCYPDCNGVGGLTIADFGCFQTAFVAGDPYADCTGTNGLTIADFGCFQTAFVAGCP